MFDNDYPEEPSEKPSMEIPRELPPAPARRRRTSKDRCWDLFELLANNGSMRAFEVCEMLDLAPSSVHRYLNILLYAGLVKKQTAEGGPEFSVVREHPIFSAPVEQMRAAFDASYCTPAKDPSEPCEHLRPIFDAIKRAHSCS